MHKKENTPQVVSAVRVGAQGAVGGEEWRERGEADRAMRILTSAALLLVGGTLQAQQPLTLDTSFHCTQIVYPPGLTDALPLADGSVIVTGTFGIPELASPGTAFGWLKLLPSGEIDESWAIEYAGGGHILPYPPYYYISGNYSAKRFLQTTGEPDIGFSVSGVNNPYPDLNLGNNGGAIVQADGKILMTGDHHLGQQYGPNAPGSYSLLRLNTDATLDSTFEFRHTDGVIWTLESTTQGRFLISGVFTQYEGSPVGRVLRIWPDGSLDTTFHTDISKGYALCFLQQPNGRIIAGGQFVLPNDPDTLHLIRLMPDGALDTTFHNHTDYKLLPYLSYGDFSFIVHVAKQLEDGTIMVGGGFNHIDGQLRRGIALLDSTGQLLNTAFTGQGCGLTHNFNDPNNPYSGIGAIRMAPDGGIFLAGAFHGFDDGTVSDTTMNMICKLHGLSVGIHEQSAEPTWQLRIFPNPGTNVLHIEANVKSKIDVRVLDTEGRAVLTASGATGSLELSSGELSPGIYLIEVNTAEGRRTVKWTKR